MSNMLRAAGIATCLILPACGYLIPAHHQTTEPSELPEGAYRLDPEHTALLFKIIIWAFRSSLAGSTRSGRRWISIPRSPRLRS